jgi:hypothetical protein
VVFLIVAIRDSHQEAATIGMAGMHQHRIEHLNNLQIKLGMYIYSVYYAR